MKMTALADELFPQTKSPAWTSLEEAQGHEKHSTWDKSALHFAGLTAVLIATRLTGPCIARDADTKRDMNNNIGVVFGIWI